MDALHCHAASEPAPRSRSGAARLARVRQAALDVHASRRWDRRRGVRTRAQGASRARETTAALARGPREFLVAVRRAGQFVGEMAAFASAAQRCASVVAAGPVRALVVPGEALRACVERVPEVRNP